MNCSRSLRAFLALLTDWLQLNMTGSSMTCSHLISDLKIQHKLLGKSEQLGGTPYLVKAEHCLDALDGPSLTSIGVA